VDRGAWEDVVLEGDDVDLTKLPVPLQFTGDAAPYITAGQIVARDPVTGVDTTGFHRLMLKDKNRLGRSLHPPRRPLQFPRPPAAPFVSPRRPRGGGPPAPRRHYAWDPSAALYGLDGLRLSAARAKIRNHRRVVRRTLPACPLRGRRPRSARRRRDHHRRRNPA